MPDNGVREPYFLPIPWTLDTITVVVVTYKIWWIPSTPARTGYYAPTRCVWKKVLTRRAMSDRKSINICLINLVMPVTKTIWTTIVISFNKTTDSTVTLLWRKRKSCASNRFFPAHLCSTDICRLESFWTCVKGFTEPTFQGHVCICDKKNRRCWKLVSCLMYGNYSYSKTLLYEDNYIGVYWSFLVPLSLVVQTILMLNKMTSIENQCKRNIRQYVYVIAW